MSAPTMVQYLSGTSTTFDSSGNRRSACDRCRNHKLRCERLPDALQCHRCVKANAQCITSAALKSGRPQQLHGSQKLQDGLSQEAQHYRPMNMNNQQPLPNFPTPPPTTFDTIPSHDSSDLDMQLLSSPNSFSGFNDMWIDNFQHSIPISVLPQQSTTPNTDQNGEDVVFILAETRCECLKKITDLQTNVFVDLDTVKGCRTADKCAMLINPSDSNYNFLIGRMLDHSKALLEILEYFQLASVESNPPSTDDGSKSKARKFRTLRCDTPTLMSLLSCYIGIVRIFRTIFSCIHDSMPSMLKSQQPMPDLFPGMNLGGFRLESRTDIQVQILIQVSEDMLAKIEAKFGLPNDPSLANRSIFEPERSSKMLQMMLEAESSELPPLDESRGNCESLRNIITNLKQMIQTESIKNNG